MTQERGLTIGLTVLAPAEEAIGVIVRLTSVLLLTLLPERSELL